MLFVTCIFSCDDILEEDISNKEVNIIGPCQNCTLNTEGVILWWEEVKGASGYQIQVVSPSFEFAEFLIADTVVGRTDLSLQLIHGNFEWRVKAQNGEYQTSYKYSSFVVDTTNVINSVTVE